jgi:thioredoxin-like negative regulator of GroEL
MKLLKFYASWCAPCKGLSLTIENMKSSITIPVEDIDIDKNNDMARKYNVRSVPTMVIVDSTGSEVKRAVGMMNEKQVLTFLGA